MKYFLILFLILASCGGATTVTPDSSIDGSVLWFSLPVTIQGTAENDAQETQVVNDLNDFFGTEVFQLIGSGGDVEIHYATDLDSEGNGVEGSADIDTSTINGTEYITSGTISIEESLIGTDEGEQILAHELGHILGCGHFQSGIMSYVRSGTLEEELSGEFEDWFNENY